MTSPHDVDIAIAVIGLVVSVGSAGLARLALARLDRDERADMARLDHEFIEHVPAMHDSGSRPRTRY